MRLLILVRRLSVVRLMEPASSRVGQAPSIVTALQARKNEQIPVPQSDASPAYSSPLEERAAMSRDDNKRDASDKVDNGLDEASGLADEMVSDPAARDEEVGRYVPSGLAGDIDRSKLATRTKRLASSRHEEVQSSPSTICARREFSTLSTGASSAPGADDEPGDADFRLKTSSHDFVSRALPVPPLRSDDDPLRQSLPPVGLRNAASPLPLATLPDIRAAATTFESSRLISGTLPPFSALVDSSRPVHLVAVAAGIPDGVSPIEGGSQAEHADNGMLLVGEKTSAIRAQHGGSSWSSGAFSIEEPSREMVLRKRGRTTGSEFEDAETAQLSTKRVRHNTSLPSFALPSLPPLAAIGDSTLSHLSQSSDTTGSTTLPSLSTILPISIASESSQRSRLRRAPTIASSLPPLAAVFSAGNISMRSASFVSGISHHPISLFAIPPASSAASQVVPLHSAIVSALNTTVPNNIAAPDNIATRRMSIGFLLDAPEPAVRPDAVSFSQELGVVRPRSDNDRCGGDAS